MLRILTLAAGAQAATWSATNLNVTTSWAAEDRSDNSAHTEPARAAGALVSFDSPAGWLTNGTGTCTITVDSTAVQVEFAHFFDAHVLNSNAPGVFQITAFGNHQDQGSFNFLVMGDAQPVNANFDVSCQNDTAVTGPVLDSFPQDPQATEATGSFTWDGDLGASSVVLDFNAAPVNFTTHDPRLTATATGTSIEISGLDIVDFNDVYFSFSYGGAAQAAYEMTIAANP